MSRSWGRPNREPWTKPSRSAWLTTPRFVWPGLLLLSAMLWWLILLTLSGCASPTPTAVTDANGDVDLDSTGHVIGLPNACREFPRLTFDRLKDTLPTIGEIRSYDAGRDKLCGIGK